MDAHTFKATVSHYFLGLMLRKRVQVPALAKTLRISQARIYDLANPQKLTLDLEVFCALCKHFKVRINVRAGDVTANHSHV